MPLIPGLRSITGHSMGGHGALICALKEPGAYQSASAFAPICHPMASGWGQGCFKAYLGDHREAWTAYDAVRLIGLDHHFDPMATETHGRFFLFQCLPCPSVVKIPARGQNDDQGRLIEAGAATMPLLIDQGTADEFLAQQLHPASLERVCAARHFPLTLRMQDDYDHSYHFIATFIGEHLAWHAQALREA